MFMKNNQCKNIFNICIFFTCLMVLPLINVKALECVTYTNGSGTEEDPYVITTPMELYSIRCNMSSHFVLGNDIDLTYDTTNEEGLFYNEGKGWISIGSTISNHFTGSLDGDDYTINGLNQSLTGENAGLFGALTGEIKNLTLDSVNIKYNKSESEASYTSYIGALVGYSTTSTISNITTSGNIEVSVDNTNRSSTGAVVGATYDSEISNVKNNINITITKTDTLHGHSLVGGIVGEGYRSLIKHATNAGNMQNNISVGVVGNAGGIADSLYDTTLINCKNIGEVTAASKAAGLVATLSGVSSSISYSSNTGKISSEEAGGLVSQAYCNAGTEICSERTILIEKSYNKGEIHSTSKAGGGIAARIANVNISNSFNVGNIYFTEVELEYNEERGVGGIAGINNGPAYVTSSYNAGMIYCEGENNHKHVIHETLDDRYLNSYSDVYYMVPTFPIMSFTVESYGHFYSNRTVIGEEINKLNWSEETTYSGFDFTNTWYFDPASNYQYPQLVNNPVEGDFATNIYLSKNITEMTLGQYLQLSTIVYPTSLDNQEVEYLLYSEMHIDKIENGRFIPTHKGTYRIVVFSKSLGGIHDEIEVTVNPVKVELITIDGPGIVTTQNTYQYTATVTPNNAENKNVTWSVVNDTGTATISSTGKLTPKTKGQVIVKATSKDGTNISAGYKITILDPAVLDIKLDKTEYELTTKSESFTITPEIITQDNPEYTISWSSSNSNIVSVDNGRISVKDKGGTATVTIKVTVGEKVIEKTINFKVIKEIESIDITGWDHIFSPPALCYDFRVGIEIQMNSKIYPADTNDDKTITWTSSDTSIATVSETGKVRGLKKGTVTITATTSNGKTDSYELNVLEPKVLEIKFDKDMYYAFLGEENIVLKPTIKLQDIEGVSSIRWETNNLEIASVNEYSFDNMLETGTIIAKKPGIISVTIIVDIFGDEYRESVKVDVGYKRDDFENLNATIEDNEIIFNSSTTIEELIYYHSLNYAHTLKIHSTNNQVTFNGETDFYHNQTFLKTGETISFTNKYGEYKEYKVIIKGDITGDGEIDSLDLASMMNHISEKKCLKGIYIDAAYLNNDEDIDSLDLAYLMNKIAGKEGY